MVVIMAAGTAASVVTAAGVIAVIAAATVVVAVAGAAVTVVTGAATADLAVIADPARSTGGSTAAVMAATPGRDRGVTPR